MLPLTNCALNCFGGYIIVNWLERVPEILSLHYLYYLLALQCETQGSQNFNGLRLIPRLCIGASHEMNFSWRAGDLGKWVLPTPVRNF
jgi:hypothetical protein